MDTHSKQRNTHHKRFGIDQVMQFEHVHVADGYGVVEAVARAHDDLKQAQEKYESAPDEGAFQHKKKAVLLNSYELFSTAGSPGKTRTYNPPVNSRKIEGCKPLSILL